VKNLSHTSICDCTVKKNMLYFERIFFKLVIIPEYDGCENMIFNDTSLMVVTTTINNKD